MSLYMVLGFVHCRNKPHERGKRLRVLLVASMSDPFMTLLLASVCSSNKAFHVTDCSMEIKGHVVSALGVLTGRFLVNSQNATAWMQVAQQIYLAVR
jgi:hypothetical protein